MIPDSVVYTLTIASGAATTGALSLPAGFFPAAVILPTIDTSTAINFQVSMDNVTYYPLHDGSGSAYSVTIDNSAANAISLDPTKFYPWEYIKITVADNQSADKSVKVVVRNY